VESKSFYFIRFLDDKVHFRGTYGLWIDGDLYHGRTCPSKTYNNELLTTNEDFIIASIEVWTFID
jgi:hypothetical protein